MRSLIIGGSDNQANGAAYMGTKKIPDKIEDYFRTKKTLASQGLFGR